MLDGNRLITNRQDLHDTIVGNYVFRKLEVTRYMLNGEKFGKSNICTIGSPEPKTLSAMEYKPRFNDFDQSKLNKIGKRCYAAFGMNKLLLLLKWMCFLNSLITLIVLA